VHLRIRVISRSKSHLGIKSQWCVQRNLCGNPPPTGTFLGRILFDFPTTMFALVFVHYCVFACSRQTSDAVLRSPGHQSVRSLWHMRSGMWLLHRSLNCFRHTSSFLFTLVYSAFSNIVTGFIIWKEINVHFIVILLHVECTWQLCLYWYLIGTTNLCVYSWTQQFVPLMLKLLKAKLRCFNY